MLGKRQGQPAPSAAGAPQREVETVGATLNDEPCPHPNQGLQMVAMERGSLARYQLPASGSLTIGRSEGCDIALHDPQASRRHAVLHIGNALELEDVGSHNGTRFRNERLSVNARVSITVGEPVRIGDALLIVQAAPRARTIVATDTRSGASGPVVVSDPAMQAVYDLVQRIAPSNIGVLILGETGVGKEVIAETLHRCSGRRSLGPFVRVNCAALTEALFESELFGHQRGAFTGAVQSKPGLFQVADGGTVFLDEVGELPLSVQAKLLRAVESREITRVGGLKPQPIDVRFVAATNRDLRADVERGLFREDLYFRLKGASIFVPPLRERRSEVQPLIAEFVSVISAQLERPPPRLASAVIQRLEAYDWPGNIRELRNVVECAILRASQGSIELTDLPVELLGSPESMAEKPARSDRPTPVPPAPCNADSSSVELSPRQRAERDRIMQALKACNGNQTRAADYLGMPRRTLVTKLSAYDIPRPRKLTSNLPA